MDSAQVNELERQASEASLRALREQEDRLRDLRGRAGTLLAASSLTASLCAHAERPSGVAVDGAYRAAAVALILQVVLWGACLIPVL